MKRAPAIAPPLKTSVIVRAHPEEPALRVLPLAPVMTVGRLGYGFSGEPIRLMDPTCSSGQHSRLTMEKEGLRAEHLGSANPTYVNGEPARQPRLLHVGDQLQAGSSCLRFEHTLEARGDWPGAARPLVEAVLAAPSDDAPRTVLADLLTALGDPRGEFISCQLAGTPAALARASDLLATHALAWAAPLPVPVESWTFARGFLETVRVRDLTAAEALRELHPLAAIEPLAWLPPTTR